MGKRKGPAHDEANIPKKQKQKHQPQSAVEATAASTWSGLFLANPKGEDRKKEVGVYEQLASYEEAERMEAVVTVVEALLGGEGVSEEIMVKHLGKLVRGLASGRKAARLGYVVVLTEVAGQLFGGGGLAAKRYPGLTFEHLYATLKQKTKAEGVDGAVTGQEERDHALGLAFGLQSLVQAKVLFDHEERWDTVLHDLLELAEAKKWMRAQCGRVIVSALEQMSQAQAETTLERIQEAGLAASPEGVAIWLTARKSFPDMRFPTSKPWGSSGNPLEHLKRLATALKESSSSNGQDAEAKPTGNWNPNLHFAWDLVLDHFIRADESLDAGDFGNFWKVAVDENLFSESASQERKFWGFLVFQKVARSDPRYLSHIFSKNLMRCMINHLSNKDRYLNLAADKAVKELQKSIVDDDSRATAILSGLISHHGVYNFDQVTKTKTIDKILHTVGGIAATEASDILFENIRNHDTSEPTCQIFADHILTLIRHANIDSASRVDMVASLAKIAYGKGKFSEKTRTLLRSRVSSALAHMLSSSVGGASSIPNIVRSIVPDAVEMDEKIESVGIEARKILGKLVKKQTQASETDAKPLQALSLLYALVILQLYNGEADALTVLDELKVCYNRLIGRKDNESDIEASTVLVEILLSLVSKNSLLLRRATQQVFTVFSDEVTEEGLKLMTDVLESGESLKGQQELFDQNDEEEGDGDDDIDEDKDDDELDSDVEVVDVKGVNGHADLIDEEETDEDMEDSEQDEDDEEAQKLDDALAKALGTHRADKDLEEESSGSDADMDDSEMENLGFDSKLVEIFSQRKKLPNKKKEAKDARENIINFKGRVLDLLELYVKEQASNPLAFDLLVPLLKLMRTTSAKHLGERAHTVISSFAKASKSSKVQDGISIDESNSIDATARLELLEEIHAEASRDPSHDFTRAASQSSLLVASSLYKEDKSNVIKVIMIYGETKLRWYAGDARMQMSFFSDENNWLKSHR